MNDKDIARTDAVRAAWWQLAYFNASLLCVLVMGMEVIGQIAFFLWKGYPIYQADQHLISENVQPFELHPFLAGRLRSSIRLEQNGKTVTTTPARTRWTGANGDAGKAIRVALLGGSTTFCSGVSDADSWPGRLQALLGSGYQITNYGVPGYSSAEAVIQLALIVPESRPHVVVLYQGWNDIHNYHDTDLGADYYRHGIRQYSNLSIERPRQQGLFARLVDVSALFRFAKIVSSKMHPESAIANGQRPSNPVYPTPDPVGNLAPDPFVDRVYLRNLGTLRSLGRDLGAYVFFVPQVLDYSRFKGKTGSWWTPHVQNDAMPGLLDRFNLSMNRVCPPGEAGCSVLSDVTARRWEPGDFIDEGHFSAKGNDAFARLMAAHILDYVSRHPVRTSSRSW